MFAPVATLPAPIRKVLSEVGYARKDIGISARVETTLACAGGDGHKAFVAIVNLGTGESKTTWGSWGGSNMFAPHNAVDTDDKAYQIPPNGAIVRGSIGGSVYASVEVHPATLAPMLPAKATLTDKERSILCAFRSLKSGPYRQDALRQADAASEDLNALVERGLLKRNAAGSTQITTEGKNAI
jgi:hypothetical protein